MNTHIIPTTWSGMTKGNAAAADYQFMTTASLVGRAPTMGLKLHIQHAHPPFAVLMGA